jgi:hypothetical protein
LSLNIFLLSHFFSSLWCFLCFSNFLAANSPFGIKSLVVF